MTLNIKGALRRNNMTQAALAEAVDITPGFMSEIISGKKKPSLETLNKIIEVLDADPSEIHGKTPTATYENPEGSKAALGFSEATAAPFQPSRNVKHNTLINQIFPNARNLTTYEISQSIPGFLLGKSDILAVDLGEQPENGDLVIATITDMETDTSVTVVRRSAGNWLIPGDPTAPPNSTEDSQPTAAILGRVVGVIRGVKDSL